MEMLFTQLAPQVIAPSHPMHSRELAINHQNRFRLVRRNTDRFV